MLRLCLCVLLISVSSSMLLADLPQVGLPEVAPSKEIHRIRLVNRTFGAISVSLDGGKSWKRIGRVLRPLTGKYKEIGPKEFTASDWAPIGSVAATAVNAIHVKVDQLDPHAAVFSILPKELLPGADRPASYYDALSTMYVDCSVADLLFGPQWSPTVGSPYYLEHPITRSLVKPKRGYAPNVGDRLVFVVERIAPTLKRIAFENMFGGRVTAQFDDGTEWIVARVLRPVTGTGRFGGTKYTTPGLLRANHPGVACFSTSPIDELGGFQIVPSEHASDPELFYVRQIPAWLVVGPPGALDAKQRGGLEGCWPLFRGTLRPGEWKIQFRWRGQNDFKDIEPISGKKISSMLNVVEIAIVPVEK